MSADENLGSKACEVRGEGSIAGDEERALDVVITEHVRNRLAVEGNDRFVKSGVDIRDAYGTLDK